MTKKTITTILFLAVSALSSFAADRKIDADTRKFLDAIRRVETGGLPNAGKGAVGDKGASIGSNGTQAQEYSAELLGFFKAQLLQ